MPTAITKASHSRGELSVATVVPVIVAALLALTAAAPGLAASPSPAPEPSPSPIRLSLEAWLDGPVPTDAAPGAAVTIGATLWDPDSGQLAPAAAGFIRILPRSGSGPASEVPATPDRPWHVTATLPVAAGGVGEVVVGVQGSSCDATGCVRSDALYTTAGVGPPEGAPLPLIAEATFGPLDGTPVAGEPFEVTAAVRPNVDWPPESFPAPAEVIVRARVPRADVVVEAVAARDPSAADALVYLATLTLPAQGTFVLEVATETDAADTEVFAASATTVTVLPPEGSPNPTDAPGAGPGDGDPGPDLTLLGLVGLVAVLAALVVLGIRLARERAAR